MHTNPPVDPLVDTPLAPPAEPGPRSGPLWYRRLWSAVTPVEHPVAWLAVAGSALVLTAALSSTTANWDRVSIPQRLGGMILLHLMIAALGERLRTGVPKTANALAHLGAALFAPTVISAVAAGGGSWRSCIAAGGCIGIMALEVQARRWRSRWMNGLQVGALALALAGMAATTHVPVGLLLALAATGVMLTTSRQVEAFATASLAGLTPVLALLAQVKFGPGTIAELGANGRALAWAAPIAGVLAGAVFLQLSRMYARFQFWLVGAALASSFSGLLIGLAYVDPSPTFAALVGPAALVLLELAVYGKVAERLLPGHAQHVRSFHGFVELFELVAVGLLLSDSFGYRVAAPQYLPLLITGLGLALGAGRRGRIFLPREVAGVGAVLCLVGALMTFSQSWWLFAWSIWSLVAAVVVLLRSRPIGSFAGIVAPLLLTAQLVDAGAQRTTWQFVLLGIALITCGVSGVLRRGLTPLDATGLTSLLVAAMSFEADLPQAMALTGVGLVALGLALLHRSSRLGLLGGLVSGYGVLWSYSLWTAPGLVKYDVASAVVVAASVMFEQQFRSRRPETAFVGPVFLGPVLYSTMYLVSTAFAEQTSARIGVAILVGIVALAVGVLTKRPVVSVGGATAILGSALIATWDQLGTIPTWAWMLLGGLGLLGLAVVVENRRTEHPSTEHPSTE